VDIARTNGRGTDGPRCCVLSMVPLSVYHISGAVSELARGLGCQCCDVNAATQCCTARAPFTHPLFLAVSSPASFLAIFFAFSVALFAYTFCTL